MLPHLEFSEWVVKDNEIFFKTSNEIKRVVSQGTAANIIVRLPGGETDIILCFPIPFSVRVYVREKKIARGWLLGENYYYVGQFGGGHRFYHLPEEIKYQYGVELTPWMYGGYLKTDIRELRSRIVHYIIENCSSGFAGIILKFRDEVDSKERLKEWLKIIWFEAGNDYWFWKGEGRTEALELFPVYREKLLFWMPEDWGRLKNIENLPAKVQ